jgi:alpha/beta superfamily hydrolase
LAADLNPNAPQCWIAGFSFGAWIGMQLLMRRPEISGFISVSPPANIYDFSFLAPCPSSGLMVQGDQDTVVPQDSGRQAGGQAQSSARDQDHLQHHSGRDAISTTEHLDQMSKTVDDYLTTAIPETAAKLRASR